MAAMNQAYETTSHEIPPVEAAMPFIRALVVDDRPDMRETMSSILCLHPWVHVIGTANDGLAAVKVATSDMPDLIVMDVSMPVMNGLKATMHIKQRRPGTRIILVSSDDDPEIALAAMDCGADGFIPKSQIAGKRDWHIKRLFGDEPHNLRLCAV